MKAALGGLGLARPVACEPPVVAELAELLPGHDFVDAFAVDVPGSLDAPRAVALAFGRPPAWVRGLLGTRNRVMGWFGLRGAEASGFPVVRSSPEAVCLGFDDAHLDFRIQVSVMPCAAGTRVRATTLVRYRNRWGRHYLRAVLPFHRRIVPVMLRGVAVGHSA